MKTNTVAAAGLCLLLAACSNGNATTPTDGASTAPAGSTTSQAPALTVTDAWAKAAPDAKMPMTGVFGTITNTTSSPITVTGATSTAAGTVELHETTGGTMQKVEGGLQIPAGGTRELRPGGDHIMLMQLKEPLPVGQAVTIRLSTSTGGTIEFQAVAKTFTGGDEKYHSASPSSGTAGSLTMSPGMTHSTAPTAPASDAPTTTGS